MDQITWKSRNIQCTHQETLYPPNDPRCMVNSRMVKVFSRPEWDQMNARLHYEDIAVAKLQQELQAKEAVKALSADLHKDWTNTYMGARAKKLRDRTIRLTKEEADRVAVDVKWAEEMAEERRKKLCVARTHQYYATERLRKFHGALSLTDALKERDMQIKLKELQQERNRRNKENENKAMLQRLADEDKKTDEKNLIKKRNATDNAKYMLVQIEQHKKNQEADKAANAEEGAKIRRLALTAALEQQRLQQLNREELQQLNKLLLSNMSDKKKLELCNKIKEEEEDEKIRIYAAGKKKMILQLCEKEKELSENKLVRQKAAIKHMEYQLSLVYDDEEERIAKAIKEVEAAQDKQMKTKEEDKKKGLDECLKYRLKVLKKAATDLEKKRKEDKDDLFQRIAADEKTNAEDLSKKQKQRDEGKRLAQLYREGMIATTDKRKVERQAELKEAADRMKDVEREEDLFQEYAKRVIHACEKQDMNTYPLKKAASQDKGTGLGINIPGIGLIGSSPVDTDGKCVPLPDVPPAKTHVEL